MLAGGAVGAGTIAQFELASVEVLLEIAPFVIGGFAVLLDGTDGATLVKKGPVRADQVLLEHGHVRLGGNH